MNAATEAYTSAELAPVLMLTERAIQIRAKRDSWPSQPRAGRGGGKVYPFSTLPEDVRAAINLAQAKAAMASAPAPAPTLPGSPIPELDARRRGKALSKADLVRLYLAWQRRHGASARSKEDFVGAYLAGAWPKLREELGESVSWKSLERWKLAQSREGTALVLADKRGLAHRGLSMLTKEHKEIMLFTALNANSPKISYAIKEAERLCKARGVLPVPSPATMRRFLSQYISESNQLWTMVREGTKAWNDKCAWSIRRDWSLLEVGDVVIADGHVLNFESLNPATGKPCRMTLLLWFDGASNYPLGWEVMASENVQCIASAFRRACITLGKIPKVPYLDNGKAFRARFFENTTDFNQCGIVSLMESAGARVGTSGLFEELGITPVHAQPYHGQSKPIERFFGTLHELESWVPSYVGNCIEAKPARTKRGEDLHRQAYERMGGRPLTLEETHKALAMWFDEYVRTPSRAAHIKGLTPLEVFSKGVGPGVDLARLDLLMLFKEVKGISKHGVSLRGKHYYHPMLSDRRHKCLVRYDPQALDSVLVYDLNGKFMCEARDMGAEHPMANILGSAEQRESLQEKLTFQKGQKALVAASAREMLKLVVLPETNRRMEALEATKAVEARRALPPATPQPRPLDAAEEAAMERVKAGPVTPLKAETMQEAHQRWKTLGQRIAAGEAVSEQEARWHRTYPTTSNFRAMEIMERMYGARQDDAPVAQAN
ncbi:MAG: transposase [Deltaproteobacteria bacterium HGW-Deltaproteobacteria-8]|nr:MAG: transposase [Deltaproteobacteria bacterium HGW-Deltaproteobacteria-8]